VVKATVLAPAGKLDAWSMFCLQVQDWGTARKLAEVAASMGTENWLIPSTVVIINLIVEQMIPM